jgi:hypothetical protein
LLGRGRGAQSQVVNHPQACECQSVASEHAAVIEVRKHRVSLAHAFSCIALRTTWRTIEDLEPYAIGRITPDRSLTVAVLNRRQAPPVDARRGATRDPSLDVAVNDNVSDDYNSLYFRGRTPVCSRSRSVRCCSRIRFRAKSKGDRSH